MKRLLFLAPLIAATGCTQATIAKRAIDTVFAEGVNAYCKLPEPVRIANRIRIAAKVHPHRIEIHCASTSTTSPSGE